MNKVEKALLNVVNELMDHTPCGYYMSFIHSDETSFIVEFEAADETYYTLLKDSTYNTYEILDSYGAEILESTEECLEFFADILKNIKNGYFDQHHPCWCGHIF